MKKFKIISYLFTYCFIICIILLSSCISFSIPSGYTQYNSEDPNIFIRNDEFKNFSFLQHKYFFNYSKPHPISLYIAKNQNTKLLRANFSYDGNNWIFFENATIINSNGDRIFWTFKSYDKNTDVGSGGHVYESIDIVLSESEAIQLHQLLQGSKIKIRLSGKYYKEYSLNTEYIQALLAILQLHNQI